MQMREQCGRSILGEDCERNTQFVRSEDYYKLYFQCFKFLCMNMEKKCSTYIVEVEYLRNQRMQKDFFGPFFVIATSYFNNLLFN